MMGEVIKYPNVRRRPGLGVTGKRRMHGSHQFQTSPDVAKPTQGFCRHRRADANMLGGHDDSQGIQLVVPSKQLPTHLRHTLTAVQHLKLLIRPHNLPRGLFATELDPFAPATSCQYPGQGRLRRVDHHTSSRRNSSHQVVELCLDGRQISKDVRVVELQVVEDCSPGAVMDKLAALVEKGGVVLVGLDYEAFALAQSCGNTKVARYATNQETWGQPRLLQHPSQHGRSRRLTMGTCDSKDMTPSEHMVCKPLGSTDVRYPRIEDGFHQGVASGHDIADHKDIWLHGQLLGAVAFYQLNAQSAKLITHGRIHRRIAARDPMACFVGDGGQPAHEGAADAQNVNVHNRFSQSSLLYCRPSAAVAQLDRVLGYEPRGRGFESCQPRQLCTKPWGTLQGVFVLEALLTTGSVLVQSASNPATG